MELRVQLEKWATQAESADMESVADMDVAIRLLNHGIESLDQLESAKQRELELLAVIEKLINVLHMVDDEYCYTNDDRVNEALLLTTRNPSQALREHEAKVLEDVIKDGRLDESENEYLQRRANRLRMG